MDNIYEANLNIYESIIRDYSNIFACTNIGELEVTFKLRRINENVGNPDDKLETKNSISRENAFYHRFPLNDSLA